MNNSVQDVLVSILADGEYYSGEYLGERLGISRAAVWKQIKKISEDKNLNIESLKGKGYRLAQALNLLSAEQIKSHFPQYEGVIEILDTIDSTNTYLNKLVAKQALDSGYIVLAEQQLAGRGRRGKAWFSPQYSNVYMSLFWRFSAGLSALEGLSLVVGISVIEALHELFAIPLKLKWPNDILYQNKKLGGILLELGGDPNGECHVIIGIGINANIQDGTETGIDQPWTSLRHLQGRLLDRNLVVAAVLKRLLINLPLFEANGFAAFAEQWACYDAFYDRDVVLHVGDKMEFGVAKGVNAQGYIQLQTVNGLQLHNSGEVSLRLK